MLVDLIAYKWLECTHLIITQCTACQLRQSANQTVPGAGPVDAEVLIIGEAPGLDEDKQGIPFCGRAGQLLTELIQGAGYDRNKIYITNIIKCRPPNNRDPQPNEISQCWRYLYNQILIIRPKIVITVGRISSEYILTAYSPDFDSEQFKITKDHGRLYACGIQEHRFAFMTMPILHTAYLLRGNKRSEIDNTCGDLRKAIRYLNREINGLRNSD